MRIKAIYKRNIKDAGKIASQVAHAVKNLGETPKDCDIIVLKVSNTKFEELVEANPNSYVQIDKGLTLVEKGTRTAAAWIESQDMLYPADIKKLRPEFKFNDNPFHMVDWFELDWDIGSYYAIRSGLNHADGVTKSPFHYEYHEYGPDAEKNVLAHFNKWWNELEINQ